MSKDFITSTAKAVLILCCLRHGWKPCPYETSPKSRVFRSPP